MTTQQTTGAQAAVTGATARRLPPEPEGALVAATTRTKVSEACASLGRTTADLQRAIQACQARRAELGARFVEREDVVLGLQVALTAGHPIVLLGSRGEAKSALTRAVCATVADARYFETLLSPYTTPEQVFGPVTPAALKAGRFERAIEGYAPTAHVVFWDEIFKGGPSLHNSLLNFVNEGTYQHGAAQIRVPTVLNVGASNEMPGPESRVAFWDRFLLRYHVGTLSDAGHRQFLDGELARRQAEALGGDTSGKATAAPLSLDDVALLRRAQKAVALTPEVLAGWYAIREALMTLGLGAASTRRSGWCLDAVAAHALLHGRTTATTDDLTILAHCLWEEEEQRAQVAAAVLRVANPALAKAQELADRVTALAEQVTAQLAGSALSPQDRINAHVQACNDIEGLLVQLADARDQMRGQGRDVSRVNGMYAAAHATWKRVETLRAVQSSWATGRRAPAPDAQP